jgi:hypothetical protein
MVRVGGSGDFTLAGPGGRTISTAAPPSDVSVIVVREPGTTLIALKRPAGGRWTVTGPGVTGVAAARGLPAPHVVARVTGHGTARTLRYRVRAAPGRRVTFAERGARTFRVLGVARGASGRLRFTPGDGRAGRREIVARVSENGIDRPSYTVARYVAPRPRVTPPRGLRVARHGSTLAVRWRRADGAASYSVVVATADGRRILRIAVRPHVAITGVPPDARGTVQVTAEHPGAPGRATATVRFR